MEDINKITEKYSELIPQYQEFSEQIVVMLNHVFKCNGLKVQAITNRVKEIQSVVYKLAEKEYSDPFTHMTDLVGLRIITYLKDDIPRVQDLIQALFKINPIASINKKLFLKENEFWYNSLHYIVSCEKTDVLTLFPHLHKLTEFKKLKFEIQVRTILQHAWAEIEHGCNYKTPYPLPQEIKRELYLLSWLMELWDNEYSRISKSVVEFRKNKEAQRLSGDLNIQINEESLNDYIKTKYSEVISLGYMNEKIIGKSLDEVLQMWITTIEQLDNITPVDFIENTKKYIELMRKQDWDLAKGVIMTTVGVLRYILIIYDYVKYFKLFPHVEPSWHFLYFLDTYYNISVWDVHKKSWSEFPMIYQG